MRLQPRCQQGQKQSLCKVLDDNKQTSQIEEDLVTMSSKV